MIPVQSLRVRKISGIISTDDIIPGRYKHMFTDTSKLAEHVFENRFPSLAATFQAGDIIIADNTFGIGSSREQAVSSLQAAGVKAIVAPRFGRIFFRNCWNLGMFAIEADAQQYGELSKVELAVSAGTIVGGDVRISFEAPPEQIQTMVLNGGLIPSILSRLENTIQPATGSMRDA